MSETEALGSQQGHTPTAPSEEPVPNGSDPEKHVRTALEALQQQPERDPDSGRFVAGTLAGGRTLARSEQFWSAVGPAKQELVDRVRTDLAVDELSAVTMIGVVDAYAEARLLRTAMFVRLVDLGGPVTTKGKARALYRAYLGALDRELKLAQVLGLERRARPVPSLDEALAAIELPEDRTDGK